MPLVTAAVLVYSAGLLAGFSDSGAWAVAAAGLVIWQGGRNQRDRIALLALGVAGFAAAAVSRATERSCAARLLESRSWEVTLGSDASPGAFVPAQHACGVRLRLAIAEGKAAAGARVVARGHAVKARNGILVNDVTVRTLQRPGMLRRWRSAIGRELDARFGADAPLARALLIADMEDLSPTLRDRWTASGLSHMLSVSGLHVGLIAVAVSLLAQIARIAKRRADGMVVGITAAYVMLIGAPLPAVRAALMLGATSLSTAVQRPTSAWAVLALGGIAPLFDPRAILDLGFQFSMAGMVALVAAGALSRRWEWLAVGGWRGTLHRSLVASTAATLLTTPLVAATFGRVSMVAPITNLAAVPVMAVLQPMLFLALLLLPFDGAAQFVADACLPLIALIDRMAFVGASLPGASIETVTGSTTTLLSYAAATAFVIAAVSRFPARALLAGTACLAALAWRPIVPGGGSGLTELHMIDVGQGDAIALRTAEGRWVLFDAGRDWESGDAGRRDVVPYLTERGGALVAFVLSHPHSDHVGGAASTLQMLKPGWYYDPGFAGGTSSYRASLVVAQRQQIRWRRVRSGDSTVVDEVTITFLAPDSVWANGLNDPNDASTVARVRVGDVAFLLTGDAEADEERWLLAHQAALLRADVLKVAHHGSNTSSTPEFLDAVRPRLALVSVGSGNMYRHPNPAVMESLAARGTVTMRTDLQGSVIVRTDGKRVEVEAVGERWTIKQ